MAIAQGRRRNPPPQSIAMAALGFNAANGPDHYSYNPSRWWVDCIKDARGFALDGLTPDANGWPTTGGTITLSTQGLVSGGVPSAPSVGRTFETGDVLTGIVDKNCTVSSGGGITVTVGSTVGLYTNFTATVTSPGNNSINISAACPNGIFLARNGYTVADIANLTWDQTTLAYWSQFGGIRFMKGQSTESMTNLSNTWGNPSTTGWATFNTTAIVGNGTTCTVTTPAGFVALVGTTGNTATVNIAQSGSVTAAFVGTFTMTVVDSTHLSFPSATAGTSPGQGTIAIAASITVSGNVATITLPAAMMTLLGTTYETAVNIFSGVTPADFFGGLYLTKATSTTATFPTVATSNSTGALARPVNKANTVGTFPAQLWTNRATPSNKKWGWSDTGSCYEDIISWANALYAFPGSKTKSLWVNFHLGQNSVLTNAHDVWDGAFAMLRDNLNTNIRIPCEQHNEVWNSAYFEAFIYYYYATRALSATLVNSLGYVDIASVTCDGTTATITTTQPLSSHPGFANIGTAPAWTDGRTGLTTNLLSVFGVSTPLNVTGVAFTVTGASTITYPCTATAGTNVVPTYNSGAFICLTAGQGIAYDNTNSLGNMRSRVLALDTRRMALRAEAIFGGGSIGTRIFPTFCWQTGQNVALNDGMKYLSVCFPDRAPKTYIRAGACAPYNQPSTGTDTASMVAAFAADDLTAPLGLWEWAKNCTYWGLDFDLYEWNLSTLSFPATEAAVDAMKDDATAMRAPMVNRMQVCIDSGAKRCYNLGPDPHYQWQKSSFAPSLTKAAMKAGNVNSQLPAVTTAAMLLGLGDCDALVPSAKTGWVHGPGTTVFNNTATNTYSSTHWGVIAATDGVLPWTISSGQFGATATSGMAGTTAYVAFVIAIATATTSLNFSAFMNAGANKTWSVTVDDGAPQTFTMTNTASGTYITGTYGNTTSLSINMSPGLHKVVLTMHSVANGDSIGVASVTTS